MIAAAQSRNGPVSPFDTDSGSVIYTVDLGNGHVVDIEGPAGATPEQLQQVIASNPQLASSAGSPSADGAGPQEAPDQYQGGFRDELPAQPLSKLSTEDEAQYQALLHTGTADQINAFLAERARAPQWDIGAFVAARDKAIAAGHPEAVNYAITYALPKVETTTGGALGRGAEQGVSLGFSDELGGIVAAGKALASGQDPSAAYDQSVDSSRAELAADSEQHPYVSLAGNVAGGLVLPLGLEKAGLTGLEAVATTAYRGARLEGFTAAEARTIASHAVARRVAAEGGAYGAAYGTGTGDTPEQRLIGGVVGGATGSLGGLAAHGVGQGVTRYLETKAARKAAETATEGAEDYITPSASPSQAADIAYRYGIKPTPSTVGGAPASAMQMGLGNVPGGVSAISRGVERENQGVSDAVAGVANRIGTPTSRDRAGTAIAEGAQAYKKASGSEAGDLYAARDAAFGGEAAPVRATNTESALAGLQTKYPNNPQVAELFQHLSLGKLAKASPNNADHEWTLGEATDALSYVRGVLRAMDSNPNANKTVTANIRSVKNAIESDVYDTAAAADQFNASIGRPSNALEAQRAADKFYADRAAALNGSLKAPLASAKDGIKVSGETVYNRLLADTQRKGGNLKRLRDTWFRLPADAKNTFAATAIDDMGRATASNQDAAHTAWSYETFLTNFDKMSPQAQRIMFGADSAKQLQEIAAYASRLRKVGKSRNYSNTAKNLIAGGLITTIGGALFHGDVRMAAEAAGMAAASYPAAKLFLATPAMRQWTRRALQIGMMADPAKQQKASKSLIQGLSSIARKNPAIANDLLNLRQKLTDTLSGMPATVAAQPGGNSSGDADGGNAIGAGQQNQQELRP